MKKKHSKIQLAALASSLISLFLWAGGLCGWFAFGWFYGIWLLSSLPFGILAFILTIAGKTKGKSRIETAALVFTSIDVLYLSAVVLIAVLSS